MKINGLGVKSAVILSAFFCAIALHLPSTATAEETKFTAKDLLSWSEEGRSGYLTTAIDYIRATLSQGESEYYRCLNNRYFPNGKTNKLEMQRIENAMKRFPDYDPRGVIFAWIKKECGEFPRIIDQ